jgi:hypothetical protein
MLTPPPEILTRCHVSPDFRIHSRVTQHTESRTTNTIRRCEIGTLPVKLNAEWWRQSTGQRRIQAARQEPRQTGNGSAAALKGSTFYVSTHHDVRRSAQHHRPRRDSLRRDPLCRRIRIRHGRRSKRQTEMLPLRPGNSSRSENLRVVRQGVAVVPAADQSKSASGRRRK